MTKSRLLRLPPELLQMVACHLDDTASISRLCRSNRHLYNALGRYLYRYDAVLASGNRCKALLATVAESNLDEDRVSIARKSLEAGADADFCVGFYFTFPPCPNSKPLPLCRPRYVKASILSAAVSRDCLPLVQVLVGFKADINRRMEVFGVPPIEIALLKMYTDVFRFLLRQPTIDLSASETHNCEDDSLLHTAIAYQRLDFVKMLMPYVDPEIDLWTVESTTVDSCAKRRQGHGVFLALLRKSQRQ